MLNWLKNIVSSPTPLKASPPTAVIEYLLNDPLTPDLKASVEVLYLAESPRFFVQGWKGYAISDIQKQAAQVYACLTTTMNMVKSVYPRPLHWSSTEALVVNPRAGRGVNASYDRAALNFLFDQHPVTKKMVYTAESVNVVAHELGHAILDAIRPDLWNLQSLEIFAAHESFADIISMLTTLQHDLVIDHVLKETNNNPRTSNVVSRIAEEMGNFLYAQGKRNIEVNALRNAANTLAYVAPETLPQKTDDLSLSQEPHSFSRVLTSIWFDCLISLYEHEVTKQPHHDALKKARDVMAYVTINAMPMAAANPRFYTAIAKSMLAVAQAKYEDKTYFSILRKVFVKHKLVSNTLMSSDAKFVDLHRVNAKINNLDNDMCGLRDGEIQKARLLDFGDRKLKMANLPLDLLKAQLEIPMERQYTLDSSNRIVDELQIEGSYVVESVRNAVKFLHNTNNVSRDVLDIGKCFCLKEGKLVRQRSCLDTRCCRDLE